MTPTPLPRDSASTTLLLVEARSLLRQMDVLEVGVAYLDAAKLRDDVTLAAIDGAAPYDTSLQISDDVRAQGKFIRSQMESPDAAQKLSQIVALDQMLRSVIGDIGNAVGSPDPLMIQAGRGKGNGASARAGA